MTNTSLTVLSNRRIILGVSGGIAAYKSAEVLRLLIKSGAEVRVVMTHGAQEFITPMTLQALSGKPVHTELLDSEAEAAMGHIELARWADLIVIAPTTANLIAEIAQGKANDLLSTLILASDAQLLLAPAMNSKMWLNKNTQRNLAQLQEQGTNIIGPGDGEQACGEFGPGRMEEPENIVYAAAKLFKSQALSGKTLIITAGPTREAIDPVRYISNHSSGKMGYALAQAATDAGAKVTLISGPVNLLTPERVNRIDVISAQEMYDASLKHAAKCDVFIACAAVADYRPAKHSQQKIKKENEGGLLTLQLTKNPDIVSAVAKLKPKPFVLGFAAESENIKENSLAKLNNKGLDMIAANNILEDDIGFNSEQNRLSVFRKNDQGDIHEIDLAKANKTLLAKQLITIIAEKYAS